MSIQELRKYKYDILKIASVYGVKDLKIFGAVARGKEDEESDIDLVVEMESGKTLLDRLAFKLKLEDLLGKNVDVISIGALKGKLKENVLKEVISI